MVESAFQAAQLFEEKNNIEVKVINLPWLNNIDEEWFLEEINSCSYLIALDNHFYEGGQGARISEIISRNHIKDMSFSRIAVDKIPECGTNDEVLEAHNLSVKAIFDRLNLLYSE